MKVLIADDDARIRRGLCAQIQSDGFETVVCANGQEAVGVLAGDGSPAIAVLDWTMPGLTGIDVCRTIRKTRGTMLPYIIILTVKTDARDISQALDAGANDYITKPFALMELRARVRVGRRVVELQHDLQAQLVRAEAALRDVRDLSGLLPICAYCRKVRDDEDYWQEIQDYLQTRAGTRFTHGICPACADELVAQSTGAEGCEGAV